MGRSTYRAWRGPLSPQQYFCRLGRRVKCTVCRKWQRTDPASHEAGIRLREMYCTTEACLGRLRSQPWWKALEAAQSEHIENARAFDETSSEGLGMYGPRGLDCRESDRSKGDG